MGSIGSRKAAFVSQIGNSPHVPECISMAKLTVSFSNSAIKSKSGYSAFCLEKGLEPIHAHLT